MIARPNLQQDGYCIVPGVLSPSEVQAMRCELRRRFEAHGSPRFLRLQQLQDHHPLMRLPFRDAVVAGLRASLGADYYTVPDLCAQHDMYGVWHADSDPDGARPELSNPNFGVAKCGIYLQDNGVRGGGLESVPAAHRLPVPQASARVAYLLKRLRDRGLRGLRRIRLPLRAGDAVIFDYRLPHISARPAPGHAQQEKFVLYFNATNADSGAHYLEHIKRRALREERKGGEVFWSDSLWRTYPADFPSPFVEAAEAVEAKLLLPTADEARRWRNWYRAAVASAA